MIIAIRCAAWRSGRCSLGVVVGDSSVKLALGRASAASVIVMRAKGAMQLFWSLQLNWSYTGGCM
jgi:hypothetical protein